MALGVPSSGWAIQGCGDLALGESAPEQIGILPVLVKYIERLSKNGKTLSKNSYRLVKELSENHEFPNSLQFFGPPYQAYILLSKEGSQVTVNVSDIEIMHLVDGNVVGKYRQGESSDKIDFTFIEFLSALLTGARIYAENNPDITTFHLMGSVIINQKLHSTLLGIDDGFVGTDDTAGIVIPRELVLTFPKIQLP